MNVIRFLYFIVTIVAFAKSSAEVDDGSVSVLTQSLVESKHIVRGSGSIDEKETRKKEETNVNHSPKRMLEAGTKRLLQLKSINGYDDCCNDNDDDDDNYIDVNDDYYYNYDDEGDDNDDDDDGKDFVASDGSYEDEFGSSCSMANDLVAIGAEGADEDRGAAYLFHMDGTEVAKLIPGYDGEDNDRFGWSVAMDEKVVVGSHGDYIRVFSRNGIYERTITCADCSEFGQRVATHGNLIVTTGLQNSTEKLFIYATEDGQILKTLEQEDVISDVAMSEQFIVSTSTEYSRGKTIIYNNTSPDFMEIAEINQGGLKVAVSGDRIVIGEESEYGLDGEAWLYKTDGTLVTALEDASLESSFGGSVAITDDKVLVGAFLDDDDYSNTGSVFIYSAVTGEFIEKVLSPDARAWDYFGSSVCTSGSYYVVGASGDNTGAAYLFQL